MKKITSLSVLLNLGLIILLLLINYKNNVLQEKIFLLEKEKNNRKEIVRRNDINELDKNDPVFIFNSRKFPCDSGGSSSYETNLCFGEKLAFADSLLTQVFESKLLLLNKYIKMDKEVVLKIKDNTFFINALRINTAQKENLVKSQKLWEQMRILNSENVELSCDGGTGCSGFVSQAETDYVLKRIKEIKNINGYN